MRFNYNSTNKPCLFTATFCTLYQLVFYIRNFYCSITFYIIDKHFIQHINHVFVSAVFVRLNYHHKVSGVCRFFLTKDFIPDFLKIRTLKVRSIWCQGSFISTPGRFCPTKGLKHPILLLYSVLPVYQYPLAGLISCQ